MKDYWADVFEKTPDKSKETNETGFILVPKWEGEEKWITSKGFSITLNFKKNSKSPLISYAASS